MLFIIGITITFFLEFVILGKKRKSLSDKILIAWLFTLGIHLLLFYLRYSEKIYKYPILLGWDIPLPLLHGPFLFLYVMALTNQLPKRKHTLYIHSIPILFSYISLIPFYSLSASERVEVFKNEGKGFELLMIILFIAIIVSSITYFTFSILFLRKYKNKIESIFSNTEKINLIWLRYLIYGMVSIYLISFFFGEVYIYSALTIFVLIIGYYGIRQVGVFSDKIIEPIQEITPSKNAATEKLDEKEKKYTKSGLSKVQSEKIYQQLTQIMQNEKIYTQSELTLVELAKIIDTHPNYLSQVINEKTDSNFYAYINNLRIKDVLKLLDDPKNKNMKLMSLAYDCGFSSKSSFNKYFKNVVGKTPTEYLNSVNN